MATMANKATCVVTAPYSNNGKIIYCKYLNICYVVAGFGSIFAENAVSNTEIH